MLLNYRYLIIIARIPLSTSTSTKATTFSVIMTSSSTSSNTTSHTTFSSTSSTTTTTTTTIVPIPTSAPWVVTNGHNYTYLGCYSDSQDRALTGTFHSNDTVTPTVCAQFCENYKLFGLEAYNWCFCGDEVENGQVPISSAQCNDSCNGNPLEQCGGQWTLALYQDVAFPN
jgi:hypothetical protein